MRWTYIWFYINIEIDCATVVPSDFKKTKLASWTNKKYIKDDVDEGQNDNSLAPWCYVS